MLRLAPVLAAAALAGVAPSAAPAATCRHTDDVPRAGHLRSARAATLCLLNRERTAHGLPPLRADRRLRRSAAGHSNEMVAYRYFDHASRDGSTFDDRIRQTGYVTRDRPIGENIAWGAGELATPAQTVRAWMSSPGHRHNILAPAFRRIGIGIAPDAPDDLPADLSAATYTTDFGGRR